MDFVEKIRTKYPYLTTEDATDIAEKAKMFYFSLQYPCDPDPALRNINTFVANQWILAACDELIEKIGFNSAVGYKENGVSWTFDNAELSDRLCNMIKPVIGVIE